jgi:hypothetical protein
MLLADDELPDASSSNSLFLTGCFLLGNGHSARAFSRPRVGVSALSPDRQTSAVTEAAIGPDVHQSLYVHLNLLAQVAFHVPLLIDDCADPIYLVLGQFSYTLVNIDTGLAKDLVGTRPADSVDISQPDLRPLVSRQVNTRYTRH